MKRVGQVTAALAAGVAGLGAAILLLPRSRRRNRTAAVGQARRRAASVVTLVGTSAGRLPGRRARQRGDAQLVEAVRTQLTDGFGAAAAGLQVTAHRRTVTLRGEVARLGDIDACEQAARAVGGVDDVNNLLRLAASRSGLESSSPIPPPR